MEAKVPVRSSASITGSVSSGYAVQAQEKRREFDRRVVALTNDYQELSVEGHAAVTKEDFEAFFNRTGLGDMAKAASAFEELDENHDQVITKYIFSWKGRNEYIQKCFELEDLILSQINEAVVNINKLRTEYDEAVKKLAEAQAKNEAYE